MAVKQILDIFGQATSLKVNLDKTEVYPICCQDIDVTKLLEDFPAALCAFPCKYLGLPLHNRKLRKVDLQPLIDKVGAKLPT